jgi:hypothetical protein
MRFWAARAFHVAATAPFYFGAGFPRGTVKRKTARLSRLFF